MYIKAVEVPVDVRVGAECVHRSSPISHVQEVDSLDAILDSTSRHIDNVWGSNPSESAFNARLFQLNRTSFY